MLVNSLTGLWPSFFSFYFSYFYGGPGLSGVR
jgi:hypothetical protein